MTTHTGLLAGFGLAASVALRAQSLPPINSPNNGANGNVVTEGTTNKVYAALNVVIVQTVDSVEHVLHYTKNLLTNGGKDTGVDALQGLEKGRTVVVHDTMTDAEETAQELDRVGANQDLKTTEGVLTRVDRGRQQITIRFAGGTTETLQLTERAAAKTSGNNLGGASTAGGTNVVVYYSDQAGHRVALFFKKVS
jgi:hypothetical protein